MPEHEAAKCPLPSSVHAPYLLSQTKEDPRVIWRTEEEYQQQGPSTYPPRNSLSPTNHPYPAQTADNAAPMSTTDTGYDNNCEHKMPPAPTTYMNTQALALVRVVGGSAGSVRLQPLWLLSPSPSVAMGVIFLYLISIYIYLCTCVDR